MHSIARKLLLLTLILSGLTDIPRRFSIGDNWTGLGAHALAFTLVSWSVLPLHPLALGRALRLLAPLILLFGWGLVTIAWSPAKAAGVQNLVAYGAFLGGLLLSCSVSAKTPSFCASAAKMLRVAAWSALLLYPLSTITTANFVGPRAFAFFALFGVTQYLAKWRSGSKLAFLWAAVFVSAIALSLSRAALVIALLLFPLTHVAVRSVRDFLKFFLWAVTGITLAYLLATQVQPLHDRFFKGDLSFRIGDTLINASGRRAFWTATWASAQKNILFGDGAGSSNALMNRLFHTISHPHNDYMRILHDYGLFGLALWLLGIRKLARSLWRNFITLHPETSGESVIHLGALLSLAVLVLEMTVDNPWVYLFLMAPTGILIGCSLGSGWRRESATLRFFPAMDDIEPRTVSSLRKIY